MLSNNIETKIELPATNLHPIKKIKEDGTVEIGHFVNDLLTGFGIKKFKDGRILKAQFSNGKANGYAKLSWPNGSSYEGECKNGLADGFGIFTFISGNVYEGEWKKDYYDGFGIFQNSDGDSYMGHLKKDQRDGLGTLKSSDGESYEGEWKENNAEGLGIKKYSDGGLYEGQWKENKINGKGTYLKEGIKIEGTFINGPHDGKVKLISENNFTIEGEIKEDFFKKETKATKPNGRKFSIPSEININALTENKITFEKYKDLSPEDIYGYTECIICKEDFTDEDDLLLLRCLCPGNGERQKYHPYHIGCGFKWINIHRKCPICNTKI